MQRLTPERIRSWMKDVLRERGWSPAEWARKAKIAPSTVNRALSADYAFTTSSKTLDKLAMAAGVPPLGRPDDTPSFVPILGYVGADPEGRVLFATGQNGHDLARMPPGGEEGASALEVRGHSMPFFAPDGSLIYFEEQHTRVPKDMLGRVVVVETEGGEVLVKTILRGSEPGLYDLLSINGPTRHDVPVRWAAYITAVIPPPKSQEMILRASEVPQIAS